MADVQRDAIENIWPCSTGFPPVQVGWGPSVTDQARDVDRRSMDTDRLTALQAVCDNARVTKGAALLAEQPPGAPPPTYKDRRVAAQKAVREVWATHPATNSTNDARPIPFFLVLPESLAVGTVDQHHIRIHDVAMATVHRFPVDDIVSGGEEGVGKTLASMIDLLRALRVVAFHIDPTAVEEVMGLPAAPAWPSRVIKLDMFKEDMEGQLLKAARFTKSGVQRGATRTTARFARGQFPVADVIAVKAAHGVAAGDSLDEDEKGFLENEVQIRDLLGRADINAAGVFDPVVPARLTEAGKWRVLCDMLLPSTFRPVPHVSDTLLKARQEDPDLDPDAPLPTRRSVSVAERKEQIDEHGDSIIRIAVAHMILRLRSAQRDPKWANTTFQDVCRAMPHNLLGTGELDPSIPATNFHLVQEGCASAPALVVVNLVRSASAKATLLNNDDLAVRGNYYAMWEHIKQETRAANATLRRDTTGVTDAVLDTRFPTEIRLDPDAVQAVERAGAVFFPATGRAGAGAGRDPSPLNPDISQEAIIKTVMAHPCTDPWFFDLCVFDGADDASRQPIDYLTEMFKMDGALVSAHVHVPLGHHDATRADARKALRRAVQRAGAIGAQRAPSDAGSSVKAVFVALVHEVAVATAAAQTALLQNAAVTGIPARTHTGASVADVDPNNVQAGLIVKPAFGEVVISVTTGHFRTFIRPQASENIRVGEMDIPLYDDADHGGTRTARGIGRLASLTGRMSVSYSTTFHAIAAGVIAQRWSPIAMLSRQRLPLSAFVRTGLLPAAPIIAFADGVYTSAQKTAAGDQVPGYLPPPKPWSGEMDSVWGPSGGPNDLVVDPFPHMSVIETLAMLQSDETYRLKPSDKGDPTTMTAGVCRVYLRLRTYLHHGSNIPVPWNVLTTRRVLVPSPTSSAWIDTLVDSATQCGIKYPVAVAAYVMTELLSAFMFIPRLHSSIAAIPASPSKAHVADGTIFTVGTGVGVQFALIPLSLFSPRFVVITPHPQDVVGVLRQLVDAVAILVESCDKPLRTLALRTLHMFISVLTTRTRAYGVSGVPFLFDVSVATGHALPPAVVADRRELMTHFTAISAAPGLPRVEAVVGTGGDLRTHTSGGAGTLSIRDVLMWDPDAPDSATRTTEWEAARTPALPSSITTRWVYTTPDGVHSDRNLMHVAHAHTAVVRKPGYYLLHVEFTAPSTGAVATAVCGPWEVAYRDTLDA